MRIEDLELNRERIQIIRSQLGDFRESLQEISNEIPSPELRQKIDQHWKAIQLIRDKLCGVDNFLCLLCPDD